MTGKQNPLSSSILLLDSRDPQGNEWLPKHTQKASSAFTSKTSNTTIGTMLS